jgi:hypothetical protein
LRKRPAKRVGACFEIEIVFLLLCIFMFSPLKRNVVEGHYV